MYRVALVQNQSEMAHYGYADARPLIGGRGYRVTLYTGDNVATLRDRMEDGAFDAIVLASNALNDRTIMDTMCDEAFAASLEEFLLEGRGFLCFHQLGLAMRKGPCMRVLPDPLGDVRPVVRPATEPLTGGRLEPPAGARHVTLLYPNPIDQRGITDWCAAPHNPRGVYWHYWDDVDLTDWDVLVADTSVASGPRTLLLATKESSNRRVVLSALPIDWQGYHDLAANLLIYAVEGRHDTAVVADAARKPVSFSYLLDSMRDQRLAFRAYDLGSEADALAEHLGSGIHSSLIIEPGLAGELPERLETVITQAVGAGYLRVLDFADRRPGHRIRPLSVLSPEFSAARLLQAAELQIHADIEQGYIDDSFWSHVETLQTMSALPSRADDIGDHLGEAWKIVANHDRDGSYDEVFGATVALWWMRARYLGRDDPRTAASRRWLRRAIRECPDRDRALAYVTFALIRPLERGELADVRAILARVTSAGDAPPSENDLTVYLKAAVVAKTAEAVPYLVKVVADCQDEEGKWVDLITTATMADTLLDARALLKDGAEETVRCVEEMCLRAVISILDQLDRRQPGAYPWGGKASVTVRCLQAWLKFDSLIDIPVHTVVGMLARHRGADNDFVAGRTALSVLQQIKLENQRLRRELTAAEASKRVIRRMRTRTKLAIGGALTLVYLLLGLVGGLVSNRGWPEFGTAFEAGFVKAWGVHLSILGAVAALLAVPWRQWSADGRTSREHREREAARQATGTTGST